MFFCLVFVMPLCVSVNLFSSVKSMRKMKEGLSFLWPVYYNSSKLKHKNCFLTFYFETLRTETSTASLYRMIPALLANLLQFKQTNTQELFS